MPLQFDGVGKVEGFSIVFTGDFSITFPTIELGGVSRQALIGDTSKTTAPLTWLYDLNRLRFAGDGNIDINGLNVGEVLTDLHINRTGTVLTLTAGGQQSVGALTGSITFNLWGSTSGNSSLATSLFTGLAEFRDNGTLITTHDFDQTPGTFVLPDITGSEDGALVNFSTGGFVSGVPTPTIDITSPTQYKCITGDNLMQADFTVSGDITNLPVGAVVEYQLDETGSWLTLDASPTASSFSGVVTITNQQSISVRFDLAITATDIVENITASFTIVAWWQSNEAGRGTNLQTVDGGLPSVPIMYRDGVFSALADPVGQDSTQGSVWPEIASLYAAAGVTICVINVAKGGTPAFRWLPSEADLYPTIGAAVTASGVGGVSMTTSIGGENDNVIGTSTVVLTAQLNAIVDQLNTDYGTRHFLTYWPKSNYPTNQQIRDAFDDVIANNASCRFGGDLQSIDITTGADPGNDGTHLKLDADLTEAAVIRHTAFNAVTSSLDIIMTGIPDGAHDTYFYNQTNEQALVKQTINYSSGAATVTVATEVGIKVWSMIDITGTKENSGGADVGVTT